MLEIDEYRHILLKDSTAAVVSMASITEFAVLRRLVRSILYHYVYSVVLGLLCFLLIDPPQVV